jgi:hypothetical protein
MSGMFRFLTVGEPHGEAFAADDDAYLATLKNLVA